MDISEIKGIPLQFGELGYIIVKVPTTGSYVTYCGKSHFVTRVTAHFDESGMAGVCDIILVDDEGEPIGEVIHNVDIKDIEAE